jgi:hypothetical protein
MMPSRSFAMWLWSLLALAVASSAANAQSYSANGQVGYLGEWELKGNLSKTITRTGANYDGPVTLRHVGLCSANGIEEKPAIVQLRVLPRNAGFAGTLAMKDDNCRISSSAGQPYSGLLSCRDGQGIPIHFTIEPLQVADQAGPPTKK